MKKEENIVIVRLLSPNDFASVEKALLKLESPLRLGFTDFEICGLVEDWQRLNARKYAFVQNEEAQTVFEKPSKAYPLSNMQLLKALDCIKCNSLACIDLSLLIGKIALSLLSETEAYKSASWSIY